MVELHHKIYSDYQLCDRYMPVQPCKTYYSAVKGCEASKNILAKKSCPQMYILYFVNLQVLNRYMPKSESSCISANKCL